LKVISVDCYQQQIKAYSQRWQVAKPDGRFVFSRRFAPADGSSISNVQRYLVVWGGGDHIRK
jgi:hypothetical protein